MPLNGISAQTLDEYSKKYAASPLFRAVGNALSRQSVDDAAFSSKGRNAAQFTFSTDVPALPATDQKKSGRCWIFSALNVLREVSAKKLSLSEIEFSQNYHAIWDKFEE